MKIFLIVFGLAILFVLGSAMAMRYFDKPAADLKKKNSHTDDDNNKSDM